MNLHETVRAKINADWADTLTSSAASRHIWQANARHAEELAKDLPITEIGGLSIFFSSIAIPSARLHERMNPDRYVDLNTTGDQYVVSTSTAEITLGAHESKNYDFSGALSRSRRLGLDHIWLLPAAQVEVVEGGRFVVDLADLTTDQVPA